MLTNGGDCVATNETSSRALSDKRGADAGSLSSENVAGVSEDGAGSIRVTDEPAAEVD